MTASTTIQRAVRWFNGQASLNGCSGTSIRVCSLLSGRRDDVYLGGHDASVSRFSVSGKDGQPNLLPVRGPLCDSQSLISCHRSVTVENRIEAFCDLPRNFKELSAVLDGNE